MFTILCVHVQQAEITLCYHHTPINKVQYSIYFKCGANVRLFVHLPQFRDG